MKPLYLILPFILSLAGGLVLQWYATGVSIHQAAFYFCIGKIFRQDDEGKTIRRSMSFEASLRRKSRRSSEALGRESYLPVLSNMSRSTEANQLL